MTLIRDLEKRTWSNRLRAVYPLSCLFDYRFNQASLFHFVFADRIDPLVDYFLKSIRDCDVDQSHEMKT